jgi:hypothetical protein
MAGILAVKTKKAFSLIPASTFLLKNLFGCLSANLKGAPCTLFKDF